MEFHDKWIGSYRVTTMPWIDGKRIYVNVQCFASGQSIEKPPVWDKTVYIIDNQNGQNVVSNFMDSLVQHIANMQIPDTSKEITLNFECVPKSLV